MASFDWQNYLGWSSEDINDLRFVGYSYIKQGLYDVALTFFEALVAVDKTSAYDQQTLGALYLEKGEILPALECFDKALEIEPNDNITQLNRAKTLFLLGQTKQGIAAVQKLKLCDDPEIIQQASVLLLSYL